MMGAALFVFVSGYLVYAAWTSERPPPTEEPNAQEAAFLLGTVFPRMHIEIHHADGFVPSEVALRALQSTALQVTLKEQVTMGGPVPLTGWAGETRDWSPSELRRLVDTVSTFGLGLGEYGSGQTAVFHVYYVSGNYADGRAVEVDGRAILFSEPHPEAPHVGERFERQSLIHEFGHAIGLVNCGIPMQFARMDPDSPCHSTRNDSVMSVTFHSSDPLDVLDDTWIQWQFDSLDLEDVRTFQSQAPQTG